MKILLDLTVRDRNHPFNISEIFSFNSFSVKGLPDKFSSRFSVVDRIIIKDINIKSIKSKNKDVIALKILKNKNIFKKTADEYSVYFNKSGSGALIIEHKDGRVRKFGIFVEDSKISLKYGTLYEKTYDKFWDTNHVDLLYTRDTDSIAFVANSLKNGSIPVIAFTKEKNILKQAGELAKNNDAYIIVIIQEQDLESLEPLESIHYYLDFPFEEIKDFLNFKDHTAGLKILQGLAEEKSKKFKELSFDYGIAFSQNKSDYLNPETNSIKFNNDTWLNYLFFINKLTKLTDKEALLYDIPVGLLNNNKYKKHTNTVCDYEDGSTLFFFGGEIEPNDFYYKENTWGDLKILHEKVTFNNHVLLCLKAGIKYIIFGSRIPSGTTGVPLQSSVGKITDGGFLKRNICN